MKKHIPNILTLGNLLCGCLGIIQVFTGDFLIASILIGCALIFDFLDGFVARLLGVSSPIGKELDSLADLVTFGVLPTMMMYQLTIGSMPKLEETTVNGMVCILDPSIINSPILLCSLSIALFSGLRLAKFNVDTKQSDSFIGLPTPACAAVVASIPLIQMNDEYGVFDMIYGPISLSVISIVLALLLIVPLPLLALKFKSFRIQDNLFRYILILVSIICILLFKYISIPIIVMFYVIISLLSLRANNK